jgi:hypothetical protein
VLQVLQDEYGGFLSERIITDYEHYAATVFNLFGDRVRPCTLLQGAAALVRRFGCERALQLSFGRGKHKPGPSSRKAWYERCIYETDIIGRMVGTHGHCFNMRCWLCPDQELDHF